MDSTCVENSEGTCRVIIDGTEFLGIKTDLESSIIKTVDRNIFLEEPGKIWKGGRIFKWSIETVYIDGDKIVPAGQWIPGKTLACRKLSFKDILILARFMEELRNGNSLPESISATGIYFSKDSSILIFPDSIMSLIISHQDENFLIRHVDSYRHPDITGEAAICFFLGVCAYKAAAGELPFKSGSLTELREMIRKSRPVPPKDKVYGFNKNISNLIMKSLSPSLNGISIRQWIDELKKGEEEGFYEKETGINKTAFREKADILEKRRIRKYRLRQFFSKNGLKMAAAAAAVVVAAFILYTPLKKALEPPVTLGLSPEQVVALYYESYNNMDLETMQDCITRSAGKRDMNEVSSIFVISKVRKGYEGSSGIITAEDWISEGKKELSGGKSIFGLTDIDIEKIAGTSFRVEYTKWITEYRGDQIKADMQAVISSIDITDTLHLSKKKNAWIIDSLKRSESSD